MGVWDRFQTVALAAFLLIFGAKLTAALATGSRPLAIGVGKRGAARYVEFALPLAFVVWVWVILSHTALPRTAILPWLSTRDDIGVGGAVRTKHNAPGR
jgi:hypothetical protein